MGNKILGHFKTITSHKLLVMKGCFQIGLFKQGLMHDLSKYSPSEFWIGCRYYEGNRSPNNGERENSGYSSSWLHHKGRNRHHFEYWIDYSLSKDGGPLSGVKMPRKYVAEMAIDRIAASKTYNGAAYRDADPLHYYLGGKEYLKGIIHKETAEELEKLLRILAQKGEQPLYRYIRKVYLRGE